MANGHPEARRYPLGLVFDEAAFVEERENTRIVTESVLIQLAAASIMSKQARSAFTKRLKMLNVEVKPKAKLFEK
jgi:hypothetical protein